MTGNTPVDGPITTEADFEAALTALLMQGYENGLKVGRPWLCRTEDGLPDWEAVVVELDGQATSDE